MSGFNMFLNADEEATFTLTIDDNNIDSFAKLWKVVCGECDSEIIHSHDESKDQMVVERVIFNPPATIIYFDDGSKSVVKCGQHDEFNPDAGLALALLKHACEQSGCNFHKVLKHYTASYYDDTNKKHKKKDTNK